MDRIEEILQEIADATSKGNIQSSSNTDVPEQLGDPNCPICHGVGYIRRDVPVGHPDFGRLQVCICYADAEREAKQQRLIQLSNLGAFKKMTFDSFNPKGRAGLREDHIKTLQFAYSQSMSFAKSLSGWLILIGGYGCGKTHLAAAVANSTIKLGVPILFQTVADLLDWMRFSYNNPESSFENRFEEIRNIHLLVLDDLGTQNATPWAQEKLFQIINYRYVNRLPTVITTNLELKNIEGRIRSRLEDPELVIKVKITAPDYRSPVEDDTGQPQLSSLNIHAKQTFGEFNLREHEALTAEEKANLDSAYRNAWQFAENPKGWLFFTGNFGCGKTHLAAAIGNYLAAEGKDPVFIMVPDLLDHLRATFSPTSTVSYDHLFEHVRSASILILDDLSTQSATPWAREKLYQILNYRYNAEMPTIITSSEKLEKIDPRIQSRLSDSRICTYHEILAPAYRPSSGEIKKPRRLRSIK